MIGAAEAAFCCNGNLETGQRTCPHFQTHGSTSPDVLEMRQVRRQPPLSKNTRILPHSVEPLHQPAIVTILDIPRPLPKSHLCQCIYANISIIDRSSTRFTPLTQCKYMYPMIQLHHLPSQLRRHLRDELPQNVIDMMLVSLETVHTVYRTDVAALCSVLVHVALGQEIPLWTTAEVVLGVSHDGWRGLSE
jgi:hypothetical protein